MKTSAAVSRHPRRDFSIEAVELSLALSCDGKEIARHVDGAPHRADSGERCGTGIRLRCPDRAGGMMAMLATQDASIFPKQRAAFNQFVRRHPIIGEQTMGR